MSERNRFTHFLPEPVNSSIRERIARMRGSVDPTVQQKIEAIYHEALEEHGLPNAEFDREKHR